MSLKASPECKKEKPGTLSSGDPESDSSLLPTPGPVHVQPSFWAPQPVGLVVTVICLSNVLLDSIVDVAPLVDVKGSKDCTCGSDSENCARSEVLSDFVVDLSPLSPQEA